MADANEEPALGGCGSGVRVVRSVSQVPFTSGLKLLSRSPSPSIWVAPRSSSSRVLPSTYRSQGLIVLADVRLRFAALRDGASVLQ